MEVKNIDIDKNSRITISKIDLTYNYGIVEKKSFSIVLNEIIDIKFKPKKIDTLNTGCNFLLSWLSFLSDGYTDENGNELALNDAKLIIKYKKDGHKEFNIKEIVCGKLTKNKADEIINLYNLNK